MSIQSYAKPSVNHVSEFQASGHPYARKVSIADGVTETVLLPRVSRWIYLSCSSDVEIAFSSKGVTGGAASTEHFLLNAGSTVRLELMCSEMYLKDVAGSSTVYIMAGLTNISSDDYNQTSLPWITE
jgi:hypothetical protein